MAIKLPAHLSLKPAAAPAATAKSSPARIPAAKSGVRAAPAATTKPAGAQARARPAPKAAPPRKSSAPVAFLSLIKPSTHHHREVALATDPKPATNAKEIARQIVLADKKRRGEL